MILCLIPSLGCHGVPFMAAISYGFLLGVVYPATACPVLSLPVAGDLFRNSQVLSRRAVLSGPPYASLGHVGLSSVWAGLPAALASRAALRFDLERWGYPRSSASMQKPRW